MFKFFQRKKDNQADKAPASETGAKEDPLIATDSDNLEAQSSESSQTHSEQSWFSRLKNSLSRTRKTFSEGLATLFLGKKEIDKELLDNLESMLLKADVGIEATEFIINKLTQSITRKEVKDVAAVERALKEILIEILLPCEQPIPEIQGKPFVLLMIGVNGAGKTTTIGKLAKKLQQEGFSVMLAAGDTFRAAAIEQLQVWGQRNQITVTAQHTGADSASVIYDALQSAKARGIDVLIADTAGRLHTKDNLMDELRKVKRVLHKLDANAPHEIMLVLDASTGQNALIQAQKFHEALNVTGIAMTKLDGTAKGGIIFAVANKLKLPIRFIGVGEQLDDLRPFEAKAFVEALFE